jgi:nucleotide-binding universal stress UspA family protein
MQSLATDSHRGNDMTIVCGIDFSRTSQRVVDTAIELAIRTKVPLHLVHALGSSDPIFEEARSVAKREATRHLIKLADRGRSLGARIEVHIEEGPADEVLQGVAKRSGASLIVVAALGQRAEGERQMGSHAERLAQHAHVPVLVLRGHDPFKAWVGQKRALRILVGVDLTQTTESALRWIAGLREFGPCDVILTHLYWPPEQFERLGLSGIRSYLDPDPAVTRALSREFGPRATELLKAAPIKTRFEPHLGRLGDRLATIAHEENADLVVVGSHPRTVADRLMHGSVSHEVVRAAQLSVVCVPADEHPTATRARPQNVLVATDFSAGGDAALPLAYSVVADHGIVHLVHVVPDDASRSPVDPSDIFPDASPEPSSEADAAQHRLLALIHPSTDGAGPVTRVHVLRSNEPAVALTQAAERLNVDLICLGTHGHTGLRKTLLGSVSSAVLSATRRPVLVAHAPRA